MTSCMVDLETFSSRPDAVVVSIGAVKFDLGSGPLGGFNDRFVCAIDPNQPGRLIDADTVVWWLKQSEGARSLVTTGIRYKVVDALTMFSAFYSGCSELWAHSTFDPVVLRSLFDWAGVKCPWGFRDVRDIRTIMSIAGSMGMDVSKDALRNPGLAHSALSDAEHQARYVCRAYKWIRDARAVDADSIPTREDWRDAVSAMAEPDGVIRGSLTDGPELDRLNELLADSK